jgi:hypothetical protein
MGKRGRTESGVFQIFFPICPNLEDEILFKGGRICNTLILLKIVFIKIC